MGGPSRILGSRARPPGGELSAASPDGGLSAGADVNNRARNGGGPPMKRRSMKPVMLKACKRCSGDLALGRDYEVGLYAECLQCGHVAYPKVPRLVLAKAA